jgi:hypothetical protein
MFQGHNSWLPRKGQWRTWLVSFALFVPTQSSLWAQEVREREPAQQDNARLAPSAAVFSKSFGASGSNQSTGVVITAVTPGSPAQVSGIEVRDTVLTVNGYQVGLVNGVTYELEREVMSRATLGQRVTLLVKDWRTGNLTNIVVNFSATGGQTSPNMGGAIALQLAQVRVWYDQYLQRPATNSELSSWGDSLAQGGFTLQDVRAYLLGSSEFYDRFGRNNDIAFLYALFDKTANRQPSSSELSGALADLNRYGSNRVGFVKQFLDSRPEAIPPYPQGLPTNEVSSALTRYQKQMASFVTWGMYLEQSALISKSNASIKLIEQYEVPGRENRREQQRLAEEILKNSNRLNQLAWQIRDRAERTNKLVQEAGKLSVEANVLDNAVNRLVQQVVRPR